MGGIQVKHALPGRIRLQVERLKGAPGLASQLAERLSQVPGIKEAVANPLTGSLLVLYDPEALKAPASLLPLSETLTELFPDLDLEQLPRLLDSPRVVHHGPGSSLTAEIVNFFSALNARVAAATGGLADLKALVPLALIFLGLRALAASDKVTRPAWYDFFWFGFSIFVMLNRQLWEEPKGGAPA